MFNIASGIHHLVDTIYWKLGHVLKLAGKALMSNRHLSLLIHRLELFPMPPHEVITIGTGGVGQPRRPPLSVIAAAEGVLTVYVLVSHADMAIGSVPARPACLESTTSTAHTFLDLLANNRCAAGGASGGVVTKVTSNSTRDNVIVIARLDSVITAAPVPQQLDREVGIIAIK